MPGADTGDHATAAVAVSRCTCRSGRYRHAPMLCHTRSCRDSRASCAPLLLLETRCAVASHPHHGQVPHASEVPTAIETFIVQWGLGINPVDPVIVANLAALGAIVIVARSVIAR